MKKFSPHAWLVYGPSTKNPDLFGWWQHPKRYVLWHTDPGGGKSMPKWWRCFFKFAHRHSLARADQVAAYHPRSADGLSAVVAPERLHLFPSPLRSGIGYPPGKSPGSVSVCPRMRLSCCVLVVLRWMTMSGRGRERRRWSSTSWPPWCPFHRTRCWSSWGMAPAAGAWKRRRPSTNLKGASALSDPWRMKI